MNTLVLGMQWGDEGKGKAIDYLAGQFDVVVRYQGGHNAGHTIYHGDKKIVLHLLPSGILSPKTISVIAHGVVVNPVELVKEIDHITTLGFAPGPVYLSDAAPLILPLHQNLDIIFEESRFHKIGTTRRGIGPAYEDLVGRRALFVRDLMNPDLFLQRLKPLNDYYNKLIDAYGGEKIKMESYTDAYIAAGQKLKGYVRNTTELLHTLLRQGRSMLFEGAQGTLLDITLGTYPFVTSSHPTVAGVMSGTGLSHKALGRVIGISKAYTTRVGEGEFPTELHGDQGEWLRQRGNEYGATTGRPRRVGWLDLVALKYACEVNGVDGLFLTKLDVLDELQQIAVATAYELPGGKTTAWFDPAVDFLQAAKPVYTMLSGWNTRLDGVRHGADLPAATRAYIAFIEEFVGQPVTYASVGTGREQTIKL
jgi:adenylosuccinate synthase